MNRSPYWIAAILAAAFLAFPLSAGAETVNSAADLQNNRTTAAYLNSRPVLEILYRLGTEQDHKFGLHAECKTQYQVRPVGLFVLSPIDFPEGRPHPTKGVWQFRYQLERCGELKFYNALFIASGSGEAPSSRAYYPGSSDAGPLLLRDAMVSAVTSAVLRSGLKDCKDVEVFDMRVTEASRMIADGGRSRRGPWKENWSFRACGQAVDVAMTFTPDAQGGGTSFSAGPAKAGGGAKP